MKNIFSKINSLVGFLVLGSVLIVASCQKDTDGSPGIAPGTPVAEALAPDSAGGGVVLTLTGSGLGDMRSIVFEKNNVPALFYSTLNTATAIVFRVPDTAYGGPQNIIFTNSAGATLTVPFKVLAYPTVTEAFPTDFEAGTVVTITGSNLDDVSKVVVAGTTDAATIISQTRGQLVVQMPATNAERASLVITNATGDLVTNQEFVNVSKALQVFSDELMNGFQSWSWGGDFASSTDTYITGAKSMKAAFDPAGSWGGLQLGGGTIDITGYKYFSFWAKGADVDKQLTLHINWGPAKDYTIPAGKWVYFKEETAIFLPGITSVNNVTFQIHDAGKTIYLDNIIFVK